MPGGNPNWKPGVSGNPGGRAQGHISMTETIRELLAAKGPDGRTHREIIIAKLVQMAEAGSMEATKVLLERSEGKVPERKEHTGADAGPITITVTYTDRAIDGSSPQDALPPPAALPPGEANGGANALERPGGQ